MITEETLSGRWNIIKGRLRQRWGQLTDDDLEAARGNIDQLVGEIQRKTGESQESIREVLERVSMESGSAVNRTLEAARGYAGEATKAFHAASTRVADGFRSGYVETERYIRERPAPTLATAFGVGLFMGLTLGLLMRPRS